MKLLSSIIKNKRGEISTIAVLIGMVVIGLGIATSVWLQNPENRVNMLPRAAGIPVPTVPTGANSCVSRCESLGYDGGYCSTTASCTQGGTANSSFSCVAGKSACCCTYGPTKPPVITVQPTATKAPPTATKVPPTATKVPPTATRTPTPAQTNPGKPIGDEARYKEANGPCVGKSGTSCVFETRTFFIDAAGKQLEESITIGGKYHNYNLTTKKWTQANLTTVSRYTASNGPCAGKSGTTCVFDTRSFWISDGIVVETITAYGKYFNYRAPNWTALSGSGSDLMTVARYAASNGPCAGKTAGTCKFDARDFFIDGNGKQLEESIMAYGKYYNYRLPEFTLTGSGTLNSIPRYAGGPCYGKAAGQCVFQTRAFWLDPQGVIESITANGRYYNYTRDGKNWPTTPPTATKVPPTATKVPPTATKIPPTATKAPTTVPCARRAQGDSNCDGNVDLLDYTCWRQHFLTGSALANCKTSDYDGKDGVGLLDFTIWKNTFINDRSR